PVPRRCEALVSCSTGILPVLRNHRLEACATPGSLPSDTFRRQFVRFFVRGDGVRGARLVARVADPHGLVRPCLLVRVSDPGLPAMPPSGPNSYVCAALRVESVPRCVESAPRCVKSAPPSFFEYARYGMREWQSGGFGGAPVMRAMVCAGATKIARRRPL